MGSRSAVSWGVGDIPSQAGRTVVVTGADLPGGVFVGPDGPGEVRGAPRPVGSSAASHDRDTARVLRERAVYLTGVHPDVAE